MTIHPNRIALQSTETVRSPAPVPIVHSGTISSATNKLERRAIEFVTVSVGHTHGASFRTQVRTNDAELARKALSLVDRVFSIFEKHAALIFELCTDHEIKIEVWHCQPPCEIQLHGI